MWGQGSELGLTGLSRSRVTRFHGRSDSEGPMGAVTSSFSEKSRLAALLEHFSQIEDPRDPWRVAHPLPEVLLLAVCGTIADCDDYDHIAAWGEAHLAFLRRFLPYHRSEEHTSELQSLMRISSA